MSAGNATTVLANPSAPMAFITQELATKTTNQIYAWVGSLAVLIWDILLHLSQDYKLLKKYEIRVSLIIYYMARITSLAYVTGMVILITAPVGNCNLFRQLSLLYPFTIPLTVLLFVIRVFTLYNNNKYIIAFFSMTWLSVLAACIAGPIGSLGVEIGPTKYCLEAKTHWAADLVAFCPFIHNTLIFVAISWAFMKNSYSDVNPKNGFKVLGTYLPAFSKSVLYDGQAYYLVTLILNVFFIATYYIPDTIITPFTIEMPLFVLLNTMASHVYRNIRFGIYRDYIIDTAVIDKARPAQQFIGITFKSTPTPRRLKTDLKSLEEGYMSADLVSGENK